jgi:hypothetical protein
MGRECRTNGEWRMEEGVVGEGEMHVVGKRERKRLVGRPRHRTVDNIKIHLGEMGWVRMCLINLV